MVASLRRTLALAFATLAVVATSASAQNGTIAGRVTGVDGGRPDVGAIVQALAATGSAAAGTLPNDEGQYRFSVSPGTYTVSLRRIGYGETERRTVGLTAGGTADL